MYRTHITKVVFETRDRYIYIYIMTEHGQDSPLDVSPWKPAAKPSRIGKYKDFLRMNKNGKNGPHVTERRK
jgi:hypothetical protein